MKMFAYYNEVYVDIHAAYTFLTSFVINVYTLNKKKS